MSQNNERCRVAFDEAVKRIGDKEQVHTFRNASGVIVGAEWDRRRLLEAMRKYGVEESGETATRIHHGLCLIDDRGPLFIETPECPGMYACSCGKH